MDALGSEPQPKGEWRFGAFVGAARNSPINERLGQTPNRDHLFIGLQAQTTVLKIGGARLSWGAQLVPVVLIRGPREPLPVKEVVYAYGFSPFAIELAVPLGSRFGIYGASAGGLIFFDRPFPVPGAHRNNFTIEYGGGASLRVGRRTWIQAGYKYHHLSNAFRRQVNPGLDGHVGYLGFWKGM